MPLEADEALVADEKLIAALEDMSPLMGEIEGVLAEGIDKNFETESAAGEKWPELAWATQEERARKGYGAKGPILQRDGGLRARATEVREHDHESAQVGAPDGDEIAEIHTSDKPRTKIPRRDFLTIDEDTAERCDAAVNAYLNKAER